MAAKPTRDAPVLVAGGAGFLGSHLSKRLLGFQRMVLAVDNLYTGDLVNLDGLIDGARRRFKFHDIAEPLAIPSVAAILNLACPASPVHYQADPIRTTMTKPAGPRPLPRLSQSHGH